MRSGARAGRGLRLDPAAQPQTGAATGGTDGTRASASIEHAGPSEGRDAGTPELEHGEFPVIRRSYQPVADLDQRLRRAFALLSLPPSEDGEPEQEPAT